MKKSGLVAGFALAAAFVLSGGAAAFAADTALKIGDKVSDSTVYAGTSPDTNRPMYTTPGDAPGTYNWSEGKAYCDALEAFGHKDWRLPMNGGLIGELHQLFRNRAAIGGFNETGSYPAGWYWSALPGFSDDSGGWVHRFSDGRQEIGSKLHDSLSLRCVRG